MTFDVEEFLAEYERPSLEVPIFTRDGLRARHAELEAQILAAASDGLAGGPRDLLDELAEIEAEIEASARVFVLRAMSTRTWTALLAEHAPSKEQRADGYIADPAGFEPAALAACAESPAMSVEQAGKLRDALPPAEWHALTDAIGRLHQEAATLPKSLLLSVSHLLNGALPGSQQSEGSPAPS